MKRAQFWSAFQPLYVLAASLIGLAFTLYLFVWNYPHPDTIGRAFVAAPQYWVWVFLLAAETMFYTIILLPAWMQFAALFREQASGKDASQRGALIAMLVLASIGFVLLLGSVNLTIGDAKATGFVFQFPEGHSLRVQIFTLYAAITALPIMLGMLLIYSRVREIREQVDAGTMDEAGLFEIARTLLGCRQLLQTFLLVMGIMVSLLPVATGALRSVLVALGQANDNNYPLTVLESYGLFYTLLMIIFYAPAHLLLSDASVRVRDRLCPIDGLSGLEECLKKRAALDDWLETKIGLLDNLRAGVVTLFPLIASLVLSVLGPNAKLP